MNLAEKLGSEGIDVETLEKCFSAFLASIETPSHYDFPAEFVEAVSKIEVIEATIELLKDERRNYKLLESSGKVGKLEGDAENGEGQ